MALFRFHGSATSVTTQPSTIQIRLPSPLLSLCPVAFPLPQPLSLPFNPLTVFWEFLGECGVEHVCLILHFYHQSTLTFYKHISERNQVFTWKSGLSSMYLVMEEKPCSFFFPAGLIVPENSNQWTATQ